MLLAAAYHPGVRRGHVFKRVERLFRLVLLHKPQNGVQDDDEQNERRLDKLHGVALHARDHERDDRRDDEDDYHHVLELLEKAERHALFLLLRQLVFTIFCKARPRLLFGKSVLARL